ADAFQLDPDVLTEIAAQLQNHPLSGSDADVEGKLYDEMVGAYCLGERGEFFTPSNICRMAVAMLNPQPHHLILDPACGTGRFLIAAATALQQNARAHSREPTKTPAATSGESDANPSLIGIDCNPELLRVAKMNQVMHGRQNGVFLAADSLKPPRDLPPAAARLLGNVDVILANPPYGEKMFVTDPSVLEQYDLGHIWRNDKTADTWTQTPSIKRRQAPEILFIERCVQFLKPGTGRAALVLPNGALGSPSLAYAREWILRHTRVLASIHLHPDTFQPVIGIRASLLLLQRKASPTHDRDDDKVFMALAEHIGHDRRGKPVYRRDDTGRELTQDVEERVKTWHEGTVRQQTRTARRKVLDDTTPRIAETFRAWLERQSR
ncbi:MAG: N-6 DNA methylase, partial [Myxococcota bacterium]